MGHVFLVKSETAIPVHQWRNTLTQMTYLTHDRKIA